MNRKLLAALFPESLERIDAGLCPTCGNQITEFRDELSRREFGISGMCQSCQDATFGGRRR